jgi:DNA (cytosine-5)-methyltransferase 1
LNYYNDNDKSCCAWLRELIKDGLIPQGDVDDRSIAEVRAEDLRPYDQCHFFAGIGGWSLALRLAGWEGKAWTGSCPCQPFSVAGKAGGLGDERHLWPAFYRLISECCPSVVFGEQVASKDGRLWLAGVRDDLERVGYGVGAADLCAAGVGAPHIRQRLYFVANSECGGRREKKVWATPKSGDAKGTFYARYGKDGIQKSKSDASGSGSTCRLANSERKQEHEEQQRPETHEGERSPDIIGRRNAFGGLADRVKSGLEGHAGDGANGDGQEREIQKQNRPVGADSDAPGWNGPCIWWPCRDGVRRRIPVEPALFPLAHGVSGRVGLLRGAGNAIVPPLAAKFVRAFMETMS